MLVDFAIKASENRRGSKQECCTFGIDRLLEWFTSDDQEEWCSSRRKSVDVAGSE